jgi:transglutaminase-like putative cysteine protease
MTKTVRLAAQIFSFRKFFFALIAIGSFRSVAAQQDFTIEPIPAWTSPMEIKEYGNPLEKEASSGAFCLLYDVEINGATQERFYRIAEKFLSSSGVEANSRLSFNFDPSYQKLVLHKIVIHRGDQVLDQLNPDKIRVIQQEKDLDRQIYNGAKTALLFLEDVRVGDWVEYAYTIRGRNPVEAGHFYDVLQLKWPFPIQTENYRLLWPRSYQPLWVQIMGNAPKGRNVTDQFYEYSWHWENRPGEELEDFIPKSVVPYATAHFSDYRTWADVADWAGKPFRAETPSKELQQKITSFRDENATDEQRIVKALQFVQDDIRYLGIENGINSHEPTDPSIVFARGYGDCKDKALLLCTILRSLGVDASPVLVSTQLRERLKGLIPTPLVFDHAIVQVIFDGRTNYVDVTRSFQRGPLAARYIENYGMGLLLGEGSSGLIAITPTYPGMPMTAIVEKFDVLTNAPTKLTVEKTFEGRDADFIRWGLASFSKDSLEQSGLDYYKKYYTGIIAGGPTQVRDEEEFNRIRITEHYFIPNIWKPAAQTNFIAAEFFLDGIMERLFIPTKKERKLPLAVPYPENFTHRIQIEPHEPWRVVPDEEKLRTKGFFFYHKTACTNNQITVVCQLMTLNYGIATADVPDYLAAVNQVSRYLDLTFTKPVPGTVRDSSPNWSIWMAAISYSLVLLIAMIAIYRYKPKSPPPIPSFSDPKLQGLGGWLILLGIGLVGAIIMQIVLFVKLGPIYSTSNWRAITDSANPAFDAMTAPMLLFELFTRLTLFCFAILLVVFFFQKRRIFPLLAVIYLSLQFVATSVDVGLAQTRKVTTVTTNVHPQATTAVGPTFLSLVIWSLYFSRSKRVKLTFQN